MECVCGTVGGVSGQQVVLFIVLAFGAVNVCCRWFCVVCVCVCVIWWCESAEDDFVECLGLLVE